MSAWHFYIAHGAADKDRARDLAAALQDRGWRAYVPGVSAEPGVDQTRVDARALKQAPLCVVFLSWQGLGDRERRGTVAVAIDRAQKDAETRRVVPVFFDGVTDEAVYEHLGLRILMAIRADTIAADSVAVVAGRLHELALQQRLYDPERQRVRIAIVVVEEELSEAARKAYDAIVHQPNVGVVEVLDAARIESLTRLAEFDFVVGFVGARLGQPGLFNGVGARAGAFLARTVALDLTKVEAAELVEVATLHKSIGPAFTNATGAADMARERLAAWLNERYPTPSGGAGLLEAWERDYLRAKLGEWAGSRHGPLAAYAGERDLRRVALYVSLHAVPQPWCYADEEGQLVVKPREERLREAAKRGTPAEVELEGRDKQARAPFLEQVLSHPELPVLTLEGEGGSGKTVLLQHVAYVLACRHLGEPAPEGHQLDLGALHEGAPLLRVPVLLDARGIADEITKHGIGSAVREAIATAFSGVKALPPSAVLDGLQRGRYVLLVDALDEVPGVALRDKVLHALAGEARKKWPLRLVITTRPAAYTGVRLPPELPVLPLLPMNEQDAERLIERWTTAQGRPAEERQKIREAVFGVRERHSIDNVLENPLLLTCLLLVYEQRKRLPDSTAALYERMVEVLCMARDWPGVKPEDKRQALEIVCAGLQEHGGTAWPLGQAVQALVKWRPALVSSGDAGAEFVARLALETALLRLELQRDERGADLRLVRPWHRSFQEYLAARGLASGGDSVETKTARLFEARTNGSVRVEDPAWEGVLRFLVGVHGAAGDDNARRYVETLHAALSRPERPKREGRILGLAASALSEYAEHFHGHALLEALPREIVAAFEDHGKTWPWRDRVLALDALGRLPGGDPRLRRDPWVKMRAGRFTMGGDKEAYSPAPEHEADVPQFWMRRWPVTVSEYREFVEAGGYGDARWWDGAPDISEPAMWGQQLRHPNRPVVWVNWLEARAFCRWAKSAGWAPQGYVVTLPTEEEWEYVVRGSEGRAYAWGNEPPGKGDEARASHDWSDGDTPDAATPVGAFPTGHSLDGLWDLTGNVWEWTACQVRKEWRPGDTTCHQDDISCHFDDGERRQDDKSGDKATPPTRLKSLSAAPRVVRGGSWFNDPGSLRAAYRFGVGPGDRLQVLGFRVVCRGSRQHD